jgi:transcriptional regulator with PAS, ATPase and Fis domain
MNLEIILIFFLVSLGVNLYFAYSLSKKSGILDTKSNAFDINSNKRDLDALYKKIIEYLPLYVWIINDNKVVYKNYDDDSNTMLQLINCNKKFQSDIKNKNKNNSKIQNIIVNGDAISFKIEETFLENNELEYFLFVARNVNEDEYEKRELNGYIRMYRDLLDASSHAIAFYSKERRLIFYNDTFASLWSLDTKWLDSKPLYDDVLNHLIEKNFIAEIDINQYRKEQIKMFYNLIDIHNDFIYLPDGRIIRVLIVPNNFGGLLFSYEDITSKLVTERSYNHLIKVYRAVLEKMSEGVAIFSPNCKLYLYNSKYLEIFKLDRKYLDMKPHLSDIMRTISKFNNHDFNTSIVDNMINYINDGELFEEKKLDLTYKNQIINIRIVRLPEDLILFLFN